MGPLASEPESLMLLLVAVFYTQGLACTRSTLFGQVQELTIGDVWLSLEKDWGLWFQTLVFQV